MLRSACAVSLLVLAPFASQSGAAQSVPAQPAVAPTHLPTTDEIRAILADRIDKQHQSVGVVIGVLTPDGHRFIVPYGALEKGDARKLDGNTVFEIGSVTKVFTSLLLEDMVQRGELSLNDPIAKYLPPGVKAPERNGRQITLVDLATHTSALPRMPDNFAPKDPKNPYADYTQEQFNQFLSASELKRDIGSQYEYSNFAVALLGQILARHAGMSYEELVESRICRPLGMKDTRITLTPEMKARLAAGHDPSMQTTANWDLPVFAGAGALRSTANDMLTFLAANMDEIKTPLAPAMAGMLTVRRSTGSPDLQVALAWHIVTHDGHEIVWHNGGTGGYRSYIGFDRTTHLGIVALSNAGTEAGVDDIGRHLLDASVPLMAAPVAHTEVAVDPKFFDDYVGNYALSPAFVIAVTREGDKLFGQPTGQPKFELFPEGPRDFFLKVVDAQISFVVDAGGKATSLVLHQGGKDQTGPRVK